MAYQHLIKALPTPDFTEYTPLSFNGIKVGYVHHSLIHFLDEFPRVFQFVFGNRLGLFGQEFVEMPVVERSRHLASISNFLKEKDVVFNWRSELFTVFNDVDRQHELFEIERGILPLLGLQAHGVHLNGYTMIKGEPHIWIAQRSATRKIAPLKYDQLVAGGLPSELSLMDNVYKEAQEEAGIDPEIARYAKPSGHIQYLTTAEDHVGIRNDVLHCYDIELPEDFVPHNQDGEVAQFMRLPLSELIDILKKEDQFKPNTGIVMLCFLMRHGWITLNEEDHTALMARFVLTDEVVKNDNNKNNQGRY